MLHHVGVFASDFAASRSFYAAALEPLGIGVGYESDVTAEFWHEDSSTPSLSLETAVDQPTKGVHIAFAADTTEQVDEFFRQAVSTGVLPRYSPRHWSEYRAYCAFVNDPDSNNIEAVKKMG